MLQFRDHDPLKSSPNLSRHIFQLSWIKVENFVWKTTLKLWFNSETKIRKIIAEFPPFLGHKERMWRAASPAGRDVSRAVRSGGCRIAGVVLHSLLRRIIVPRTFYLGVGGIHLSDVGMRQRRSAEKLLTLGYLGGSGAVQTGRTYERPVRRLRLDGAWNIFGALHVVLERSRKQKVLWVQPHVLYGQLATTLQYSD
jgi:hypothetical protein